MIDNNNNRSKTKRHTLGERGRGSDYPEFADLGAVLARVGAASAAFHYVPGHTAAAVNTAIPAGKCEVYMGYVKVEVHATREWPRNSN